MLQGQGQGGGQGFAPLQTLGGVQQIIQTVPRGFTPAVAGRRDLKIQAADAVGPRLQQIGQFVEFDPRGRVAPASGQPVDDDPPSPGVG